MSKGIDLVVKNLPKKKSPGPDDYNDGFIKHLMRDSFHQVLGGQLKKTELGTYPGVCLLIHQFFSWNIIILMNKSTKISGHSELELVLHQKSLIFTDGHVAWFTY